MKSIKINYHIYLVWMCFLVIPLLFSCSGSKWIVPAEYTGTWESASDKITVRTKLKNEPFRFTSDYARVSITIHDNKTASGTIGSASFENAKLRKNADLPWETGVEYIITCDSLGKIFTRDPMESKEVEIWLGTIDTGGKIRAELRYTEGSAVFPMAGLLFTRLN